MVNIFETQILITYISPMGQARMKREDKFGRPIYSEKVWQHLVALGNRLESLGYIASTKSPNLFYRRTDKGTLYADLRGTEEVAIWDEPCPMIYFYPTDANMPDDEKRKILKSEFIKLKSNRCEPRVSYMEVMEPDGLFFGDEEIDCDCTSKSTVQ